MTKLKRKSKRSDRTRQAYGVLLIVLVAAFLYVLTISDTPNITNTPATVSLVSGDQTPDINAEIEKVNSTTEATTTLTVVYRSS